MSRPTKATINLQALIQNYRLAMRLAPNSQTLAVVKANAYGHGVIPVATALESEVPAFAVACIEEAMELRNAGIQKPILLLEGVFCIDDIALAYQHNFWLVVENLQQLDSLEHFCDKHLSNQHDEHLSNHTEAKLGIWLAIDSGMHRLGFMPEQVSAAYHRLKTIKQIQQPLVMMSHFACADEKSNPFTTRQIERFDATTHGLTGDISLANSAAILAWPDAHRDWNRPGFMLYGASPFNAPDSSQISTQLKAVMCLTSQIISLRHIHSGDTVGYGQTWQAKRPSIIATVAIGYGDGYPRNAHNGTPVIVNGQRAQLVGRVSMDMITIDVTDIKSTDIKQEIGIGTEVELWGEQLCINEVAEHAETIGYELMTRMPLRVPRVYVS